MRIKKILFVVGLLHALPVAAETLYVQSDRAALLEEPSLGAEELAPLNRGEELESLARDGSWYRVRVDEREGWIARLVVGSQPPMERKSLLDGEDARMDNPRRRPSEVATAAAARGLTPEERERMNAPGVADYQGIEAMESLVIEASELREFGRPLTGGEE